MKPVPALVTFVAAFCLLPGCESPGRALQQSAIDQIHDGQTTRADVERIFGEPAQLTKNEAGSALYRYRRFYGPSAQQTAFGDESHLLILTILFNSAGVVEKHLFSHTKPDFNRQMRRAGRRLAPEQLARIIPKKTTCAELDAWFGPHWSEELTLSGHRMLVWLYADSFNMIGRVDTQALEVICEESGVVSAFRVTKPTQ